MAGQAGALRGSFRPGRHDRYPGAPPRPAPRRIARPAVRHRQPRGRRREHRRGRGGQGVARRLHPHDGHPGHAGDQPVHLHQDAVRHAEGLRAGVVRRARAQCARGASRRRREVAAGAHRLRTRQPEQAQFRLAGRGHDRAPLARALQEARRRADPARALQGKRPGAQRSHRRAGADDDRQPALGAAAYPVRESWSRSASPRSRKSMCCPMCRPWRAW